MAIPQEKDIIQPLLQYLSDGQEHTSNELFESLALHFNLTSEERQARTLNGANNQFKNNIAWALARLNQEGCVEKITKGRYRIAPLGLGALPRLPKVVDRSILTEALSSIEPQSVTEEQRFDKETPATAGGLAFPLEAHLRDFIARNIESINFKQGQLTLYEGPEGIEYKTGVGSIDILARDQQGNLVVFELKVARGQDQVLGQIARYMGWVSKHLAIGKSVFGIIVVNSASESLKYAVSIMPNVSVYEYSITFSINAVYI